MKKSKIWFSPFQGKQMYQCIMEMLLNSPELFEQLPGVTAEQRECYEAARFRMELTKKAKGPGGAGTPTSLMG